MVILIIGKLSYSALKREKVIHVEGAIRRQRVVSVAVNGHQQFGNPVVRISSDRRGDEAGLRRGEAIHWGGELLRLTKALNTDMEEQAQRKGLAWETPWTRVSQSGYWHFRPDSFFWGAVLCLVGYLATSLTFTH